MTRLLLLLVILGVSAATVRAQSPASGRGSLHRRSAEHRLAPSADREDLARIDERARKAAAQPSNELEARHYFRTRSDVLFAQAKSKEQALLEELLRDREAQVKARRVEAVALLERFIRDEPESAPEMSEALLRLSELTWELARIDYLAAFDAWQNVPEQHRSATPPAPDYRRTLALYDRILARHPDFDRIDFVLYMKGFVLLERGEEEASLALFQRILRDFPQSRFRPDAHMALAEHVFNGAYDYRAALVEYDHVLEYEESELYDLALFKSAWCLWQLGKKTEAAVRFRRVLDIEGARAAQTRKKRLKELQSEALEYLIQVFTEDENHRAGDVRLFLAEIGGERHVLRVLTRLSTTYFDQARFDRGIEAYALLLSLDPGAKEAPDRQLAVARGHMAMDDFAKAKAAYETLASSYGPGSTWASQQPDPETVTSARASIDRAIYDQALSLHEIGQRDDRKEYFEEATVIYEIHRKYFEDSPHAYETSFYLGEIYFHRLGRFAQAGDAYLAAAHKNPKGPYTKDALYNAVSAFERVREQEIVRCAAATPCLETENDKKFSAAIELYAQLFPNDPDLPEILFRQGKLYYDRKVYDPAVRLFGQLLDRFPKSPYAAQAGELVLDSFNRAADYDNIEKWARKLKKAPAFASASAQKRLDGLILGAMFKLGEQLAAQNKHEEAAAAYTRAADEFPQDPRAPKARYNAGLSLARAGLLSRADAAYTALALKYPGSEEGALGTWNGAQMYESVAQFEDAARFYELYADKFPKAEKAGDALYNAELLHVTSGEHDRAVDAGRRFVSRYGAHEALDDAYFLLGRAQAEKKQFSEAAATYREYIRRSKDPDRRIEAGTRLGQVLLAARDKKGADRAFDEATGEARRHKRKLKSGRYYGAEARFLQGDQALEEFEAVKIEGDLRGLSARLKLKAKLLGKAASIYGDVVEFEEAEWVTAALYKIGRSYELFAKALTEAPLPGGLNEDEQQIYRDELSGFVVPIEERALEAYEGGYRKARELGIYNRWTVSMREGLSRLNDVAYPPIHEIGGATVAESPLPTARVLTGLARAPETTGGSAGKAKSKTKPAAFRKGAAR